MTDAVWFLVIHHVSPAEISTQLADRFGRPAGTPIPLDTVKDYIARATKAFQERNAVVRQRTKELQLERLYSDLRVLRGGQDRVATHRIEDLIAKIEGNMAPKNVRLSGVDGGPIPVALAPDLTSDEQRKRLAQLMDTARQRAAAAQGTAQQPRQAQQQPAEAPPADVSGDPAQ